MEEAAKNLNNIPSSGMEATDATNSTSEFLLSLWRVATYNDVRACLSDNEGWRLARGFQLLNDNPRLWRKLTRNQRIELAMLRPGIKIAEDRAKALTALREWFDPETWPEIVAPHLNWLDRFAVLHLGFNVPPRVVAKAKAVVDRWSVMWALPR